VSQTLQQAASDALKELVLDVVGTESNLTSAIASVLSRIVHPELGIYDASQFAPYPWPQRASGAS
jgi:hypothetical protein